MHEFVLCVYVGLWMGFMYHSKSCNVNMNECYLYSETVPKYAIANFMNNHFL